MSRDRVDRSPLVPLAIAALIAIGVAWAASLPSLPDYVTQERKWRTRCEAKGGTPVATEQWHYKSTTHFGAYVCAKVERIEP